MRQVTREELVAAIEITEQGLHVLLTAGFADDSPAIAKRRQQIGEMRVLLEVLKMSNLRSDCRDLLERDPPNKTWQAHIKCLIAQIDELEENWHAAERNAGQLLKACQLAQESIVATLRGETGGILERGLRQALEAGSAAIAAATSTGT